MPADIVIRGGTVFDGSGAPGRVADVAITDGVIVEIGTEPRRRPRARRVGLRGHARLHRHPHALRRAGVLGPGAAAVVVPRRHHRGGRQLRLRDRADAARAPRPRSCARSRTSRTWIPATLVAGIAWDFETFPEYLDSVRPARHRAQLHRVRRALRAAALRDGRRRLRARGHRPTRSSRCATLVREGDRARARPASPRASRTRTAASTASRCRAASPTRDEVEALFLAAGDAGKGVVLITPGRAVHLRRRVRVAARASAARSRTRCSRRRAASTSNRCGCTRQGLANGAQRVAAGDAPAAHDAVHDGRRVQPQHRARCSAS